MSKKRKKVLGWGCGGYMAQVRQEQVTGRPGLGLDLDRRRLQGRSGRRMLRMGVTGLR